MSGLELCFQPNQQPSKRNQERENVLKIDNQWISNDGLKLTTKLILNDFSKYLMKYNLLTNPQLTAQFENCDQGWIYQISKYQNSRNLLLSKLGYSICFRPRKRKHDFDFSCPNFLLIRSLLHHLKIVIKDQNIKYQNIKIAGTYCFPSYFFLK